MSTFGEHAVRGDVLIAAAAERGMSELALTTALMHGVLGERLIEAVLDDRSER